MAEGWIAVRSTNWFSFHNPRFIGSSGSPTGSGKMIALSATLEESFASSAQTCAAPQIEATWLSRANAVTDMNAALFDAANKFHGCIPGILEVLRRQGLIETNYCLNPTEVLSPGQAEELTRVSAAYPDLIDDDFVAQHRDEWLR